MSAFAVAIPASFAAAKKVAFLSSYISRQLLINEFVLLFD